MNADPAQCAREIIEVIPLVMRTIRAEIRSRRFRDLSLAQFRALAFLGRNPGAMLSEVADHLGLTLPTASKLMDGLVVAGLVARRGHGADRRRLVLELTPAGQAQYRVAYDSALALMGDRVARLSATERAEVVIAMAALRRIFSFTEQVDPQAAFAVAAPPNERKKAARPAAARRRATRKPSVYAHGSP